MQITGFVWLEDIAEKLAQKHGVHQQEVREVFANLPHFRFIEKGHHLEKMFTLPLGRRTLADIW